MNIDIAACVGSPPPHSRTSLTVHIAKRTLPIEQNTSYVTGDSFEGGIIKNVEHDTSSATRTKNKNGPQFA